MMNIAKIVIKRMIVVWALGILILSVIDIHSLRIAVVEGAFQDLPELYYFGRGSTSFAFAIFFLTPVSYGWLYYSDCRKGYIKHITSRVSIQRYRFTVLVVLFIMAFIAIFVRERIAYYWALHLAPGIRSSEVYGVNRDLFLELKTDSPYLYCLLYGTWQAFVYALYASFAVITSFFSNSFFLISTTTVLYRYGVDLVATRFSTYPVGSMIYAGGFNSFYTEYTTPPVILLNVIFFIVFQALIYAWGSYRERGQMG